MKIASAFHVDLTMMKNFEDPEIIEAYKQMCERSAKNQIQLSSGAVLTINTYKMYVLDYDEEVTQDNARYYKFDFIESIARNDEYFKKDLYKVPVGFVIQVEIITVGNLDEEFYDYVYGCSVKSHLDKWDRMKGLKVAYNDLMKSSSLSNLSKNERRKVAEIVGLCN